MLDASTVIAAWLSLFGSAFTIWFTMFRRGTVRMTQPGFLLVGPDCGGAKAKLAVGAHLYTTAQRGAVVEAMFARVSRGTVTQDFDVWVYGKGSLSRGTAVHIGQAGLTGDHHFLLPEVEGGFQWLPGEYTVEILGTMVGRRGPHRFWKLNFALTDSIHETGDSVFFDWRPGLRKYDGRVFRRHDRATRDVERLRELIFEGIGAGNGDERSD